MKIIRLLPLLLITFQATAQYPNLLNRLDSLSEAYDKNNFPGVILVAKGENIIYNKAWGYADIDKKIKLSTKSLFKTESTGKMYTATAIMQLIEKGKLNTSQTIQEILPALQLKNADKITIQHLLMHTSGLQSPWDSPDFSFKKAYNREEMEKLITGMALVFDTPGKEMYYSNSGYIILSWIIEKISGQSFDDYLSTHIFQPQKMTGIRHLDDTVMIPGEAQPYRFLTSKKHISFTDGVSPKASGAGGWVASATDLYRFMLGLDKNKYMKPATLLTMRTANPFKHTDSSYRFYAYGIETFFNNPIKGTQYFGHSGGGGGFSIDAIIDPATHYIIIFCSNIYANSRSVTSNYLRVALNQAAEKIQLPNSVRVYDMIEIKGIADFIENEKKYFGLLNLNPDERLFTSVGDAMETAKDFRTMASWMELANQYFPENGFILLLTGNSYAELGEKEKAIKKYQAAKTVATKNNDTPLLAELERRLKL